MRTKQRTISYGPVFQFGGRGNRYRWLENASKGLRVVEPGREYTRECTGYYIDNFQDSVTCPRILRLPHGRLLAATTDPHNDDAFIVDVETTDDERTAWKWAFALAERYSDVEREDDMRFQAEQQIEHAREQIAAALVDIKALREVRKEAPRRGKPAVSAAIERLRDDVAKLQKRIETLTEAPWQAVA